MAISNWCSVFDSAHTEPGLPEQYLADDVIESYLFSPLTDDELCAIRDRQLNPFPANDARHATWRPFDPATWRLPTDRPLPPSYKSFLGWSNGGLFITGEREFGMLKAQELREYMLLYDVPQYMSGAVPFALNGGGCLYLFDVRNPPDASGEYPILFAATDNLNYDDSILVARSFPEVCRGRGNPETESR
jgi:hypothetical protein